MTPIAVLLLCVSVGVSEPVHDRPNLAAGKPVAFAPKPNYTLTAKGDTDEYDLTDGAFSVRPDHCMWFEKQCVGFSYIGRCNVAVDLGQRYAVEEVGLRWQGGSPQAGICFPPWVEVLVSDDGERYFRVAEYSRWNADEAAKFGVPRDEGKGWIHHLRFTDLNAAGRFVGVSFYGAGLSVIDEMFVRQGGTGLTTFRADPGTASGFSVASAQPYWHKPELLIVRDFATPNALGLIVGASPPDDEAEFILDLPPGIRWEGGAVAGVKVADLQAGQSGAHTRYTVPVDKLTPSAPANKTWGRLYLISDLPEGEVAALRCGFRWGDGEPRLTEQPLRSVTCPSTPVPSRLTTTLGWWSLDATMEWPDGLRAWRRLGMNTVPAFAHWTDFEDAQVNDFLQAARAQGFKLLNVDSPWHRMLTKNKGNNALFCQFADGTTGSKLCPSFRGEPYRQELQRLARECASLKADLLTADIELWGWAGPKDCDKCTRCQADFEKSGAKTLDEWKLQKGFEMWRDLANAVRGAMKAIGKPDLELGAYDFRPGMDYQKFWPFDRFYPEFMHSSQVSTYTPLYPYHLEMIGREVRQDRERLGRSDVIPWLTPGDAGTFPGEALYQALLECYANGARGVLYWSGRVWDAESLLAQARAIRVVAQVEEVIVEGELAEGVRVQPEVHVSGMRKENEWFLVVANYFGEAGEEVKLHVPVQVASRVIELEAGESLGSIASVDDSVTIRLPRRGSVPIRVRPK